MTAAAGLFAAWAGTVPAAAAIGLRARPVITVRRSIESSTAPVATFAGRRLVQESEAIRPAARRDVTTCQRSGEWFFDAESSGQPIMSGQHPLGRAEPAVLP